ncbi:metallophosphoesterase [Lacimicrobium alkaliphilum]|uniref:Metallophosphoesterase n=1 Tax=Lacimicrobium alkaliphilum TaxID=1526571 RepID=A0ABQ1RHL3_9ALTE|nr:metallophosphoesterase [Lacimicrobium alkaliphilum]GGD70600.1 metallophosphoesterase [Lacimicrobium alkaliphilum]
MRVLLAVLLLLLYGCGEQIESEVSDGPYVFKLPQQWQAFWVCEGVKKEYRFSPPQTPMSIEKCGYVANISVGSVERPELIYDDVAKIAAISDIHGQAGILRSLLAAQGITDYQGNWNFSDGHLVVVGDVFDRGPQQTESLWLLYELDFQARAAGGRVHYLLGNHEVMVLNNDLRYLHDKYQTVQSVLGRSLPELYGKNTVLGQWLQSRNVLVKINDMLFTHGGLHPDLVTQSKTLSDINQEFTGNLIEGQQERHGFARYLHKSDGPVWYRGYFREPQATKAQLDGLLEHFNVHHIVVGHTTQNEVTGYFDNKVIAVDAGIKRGKTGEMLLVEKQLFFRGLLDGSRLVL